MAIGLGNPRQARFRDLVHGLLYGTARSRSDKTSKDNGLSTIELSHWFYTKAQGNPFFAIQCLSNLFSVRLLTVETTKPDNSSNSNTTVLNKHQDMPDVQGLSNSPGSVVVLVKKKAPIAFQDDV